MLLFLNIISSVLSLIPRRICLLLGRVFGITIYYFGVRKEVCRVNLKIAFPQYSFNKRESILVDCYKHFGMVAFDFLSQKSINKNNFKNYFVFDDNLLKKLKNADGGCILTAHIGNWESIGPFFGLSNLNLDIVMKEQRNQAVNQFYEKIRDYSTINLIWKKQSIDKLYEAQNQNRFIGLASDQNAGKKGYRGIFFNEVSSFPKGAGIFYSRTKCKIFFLISILGSDFKYHIINKEITIDSSENKEEIISELNDIYISYLEKKITQFPHQYFWFHKKWDMSKY